MACTSPKKRNIIFSSLLVLLFIAIIYIYSHSAQAYAYQYISAYNNEDWEQVCRLYNQEILQNQVQKEEIIDFLKEQRDIKENLKIRRRAPIGTFIKSQYHYIKSYVVKVDKEQISIPIEYISSDNKIKDRLNMIRHKEEKKWTVEFPYELESVYVFAPMGSRVYIDGKEIIESNQEEKVEIKNILPGDHTIIIDFYNNIYPSFVQTICVPEETQVYSPYKTYEVEILAPKDTWVKLGSGKKYNFKGSLIFANVIQGEYPTSIYMNNGKLRVYSQMIEVREGKENINLTHIKANKVSGSDVDIFFQEFNEQYEKGIINGNEKFLHDFILDKNSGEIISDFKMWYVDHKNIKEVHSLMNIRDIYVITGKELKISVLEIVYLTNIEKDSEGESIDQEYRVAIEWEYRILKDNSKWKIINREILQSTVAYKDEEGRWIQY